MRWKAAAALSMQDRENTMTKVCAPIFKVNSWGGAGMGQWTLQERDWEESEPLTTLNIAAQLRGELSQSA